MPEPKKEKPAELILSWSFRKHYEGGHTEYFEVKGMGSGAADFTKIMTGIQSVKDLMKPNPKKQEEKS